MTEYYVDGAVGNDANAGTAPGAGNARKTIASGYSLCAAGDRLNIQVDSTYTAEVTFATAGSSDLPITIEAYSAAAGDCRGTNTRATITPSSIAGNGAINLTGTFHVLRNLRVLHAVASKDAVNISGNDNQLINCQVGGASSASRVGGAGIGGFGQRCVFLDCLAEFCTTWGLMAYISATLDGCTSRFNLTRGINSSGTGNTIVHCRVYGNAQEGVYVSDGRGVAVRHCDIADNTRSGIYFANNWQRAGSLSIRRCNIAFNGVGGAYWGVESGHSANDRVMLDTCLIYGNGSDGVSHVKTTALGGKIILDGGFTVANPYADATASARQAANYRKTSAARDVAFVRGDGVTSYADPGAVQEIVMFQDQARLKYGVSGTVWFVSSTGNDANDGLSWTTAKATLRTVIQAATAGDLVVFAGTHTITDSITCPDGVNVFGVGELLSVITFPTAVNKTVLIVGNNARYADFTVKGNPSADWDKVSVCIGSHQHMAAGSAKSGVVFERITCYGGTDVMLQFLLTTGTFTDCTFFTNFDIVRTMNGTAVFRRCSFWGIGVATGRAFSGIGLSHIYLEGCRIHFTGTSVWGIYDDDANLTHYHLQDTTIFVKGTSLSVPLAQNYGVIETANCVYDAAACTGTITQTSPVVNCDATVSSRSTLAAGAKMDLADSLNATGVADLKTKLGTIPASGNWNTVAPDNASAAAAAAAVTDETYGNAAIKTALGNISIDPQDIRDAMTLDTTVDTPADGSIDAKISGLTSGAWAVTFTVTDSDSDNPIEGAKVRMTKGAQSWTVTTDADGESSMSLDDGEYALTITAAGYGYATDTVTVAGAAQDVTPEMDPISVSASAAPLTTVYATVVDSQGTILADQDISFILLTPPTTAGRAYTAPTVTATSDSNGLVTVQLLRSAKYHANGIGGTLYTFTTADADTTPLPAMILEGDPV